MAVDSAGERQARRARSADGHAAGRRGCDRAGACGNGERHRHRAGRCIDIRNGETRKLQRLVFGCGPASRQRVDRRIIHRIDGQRDGRRLAVAVGVRIAICERVGSREVAIVGV